MIRTGQRVDEVAFPALMMKLALVMLIAGVIFYRYGSSYPVYTQSDPSPAVYRAMEDAGQSGNSREWHRRMREFETPHKRFTDGGCGLSAGALGLFAAALLWKRIESDGMSLGGLAFV